MTAQDMIDDVLTDIGVIAAGETPSSDERNYALRMINQVIDSWSAQALPLYQITRETVALNGSASYGLGARPVKIKAAAITAGGVITPIEIVTAEQWADGGRNRVLYHDGGFPTGAVWLRPVATSGTLEVYSYRPLSRFAALSTEVDLPPGYELALRRALGVDLAGGFGVPISEPMVQLANDAKMSIQGLNAAVLGTPVPAPPAEAE